MEAEKEHVDILRPEPGFEPGSWDPQSQRMANYPTPALQPPPIPSEEIKLSPSAGPRWPGRGR